MLDLDKRILPGKNPLTCFDTEQAKEFLGKECYFSNCKVHYKNLSAFEKFENLTDYCIGTLTAIMDLGDRVFDVDQQCKEFRYCLPCEWVKEPEKKYRPYSAKEFIDKFEFWLGRAIRLRTRDPDSLCRCAYEYKTVFTGYRQCDLGIEVFLNGKWYTMDTLLGSLEYMENNEWKPFGVEVKE